MKAVAAGALALLGILLLASVSRLPLWVPIYYAVMSVITFATYRADKAAARKGTRRIRETTLLGLGLLGGWPGALAGQQVYRHKTQKQPFRALFFASVALNVVTLAWVTWGMFAS